MPEIITIEGFAEPGATPGKKYRKAGRGLREVISVRRSDKNNDVCVVDRFGAPGDAGGMRMADLCRAAGIPKMWAGGKTVELNGLEDQMAQDLVEFPDIEGLEDLDALFPMDFLKSGALGTGVYVGARLLGDAAKFIPGPWWGRTLAKGAAGVLAGRLLWNINRDAGLVSVSTLLGSALYDDLAKPQLAKFLPAVFGSVDVEETRLLGELTPEERELLGGAVETDEPRHQMLGGQDLENQDTGDAASRRDSIEVQGFNQIGSFLQ